MKNYLLSLLLITLCCTACTEEPDNQQQVIDAVTKTPVANATVQLIERDFVDLNTPVTEQILETTFTDNRGYYNFNTSFDDSSELYTIRVYADKYVSILFGQSYPLERLVEMIPQGYLSIHIKQLDPEEFITADLTINLDETYRFHGPLIDTTIIEAVSTREPGAFTCWLTRTGTRERYLGEEDIVVPRHDTVNYQIVF